MTSLTDDEERVIDKAASGGVGPRECARMHRCRSGFHLRAERVTAPPAETRHPLAGFDAVDFST
jgi:hypothetical protein